MAAVLLIEDVQVVRMALVKFLSRGGHAVTACGGGQEAWAALKKSAFDIVVTDLWMKDGSGLDFIQRFRASGKTVPIIVITSGDPTSLPSTSANGALRAGASRILIKPVTSSVLLEAIAAALPMPESAAACG